MPLFEINNLSLSFKDNQVLKNINLRIQDVGLVALTGKSGSGKSSLLNILFGILKPTSGTVLFENQNILKFSNKAFARYHSYEASMVFQHYNLISSLTSFENVLLPLLIRGEKKNEAKRKANTLFKQFNLDYIKDHKVDTLSGGEKQRVAILRSLSTSPKVIFADEPTGALDSANSILIMEMFKKISESKCVILVSHNNELINKYYDRKIVLKNGEIASDKGIIKSKNINHKVHYKLLHKNSWTKLFFHKYMRENRTKNLFSCFAMVFGFLSILLSFGFSNGSNKSQNDALNNNYSSTYATASMKSYVEIENSPLSYEKNVRPSLEEVDNNLVSNLDLIFKPNLEYAFPSMPFATFNKISINDFLLTPVLSDEFNSLEEVVVNKEFCNLLNLNSVEAIGTRINIQNNSTFSYSTNDINNPIVKDVFTYDINFKIIKVINEFSFLNTPKIYYSFDHLENYLKSNILNNISKSKGSLISVYTFIEEANNDDPITSYSMNVFLKDRNYINEYFDLIANLKNSKSIFQIDSTAYETKNAYISFIDSISNALFIFVIIAFIGVNFIVAIISLSSFIERKKDSAILTCLGAKNNSIMSIYLNMNTFLIFVCFLIAIALSIPIQIGLNMLINHSFSLNNLIDIPYVSFYGIHFLLPIALFIIFFLISTLFVVVPILFYRHFSLAEELRDE